MGTYDGKFYALDAATGDVKWQIDAHGAVHAAPTVMEASSTTRSARAAARRPAGGHARTRRDLRRPRPRRHAVWRSRPASSRTRWSPTGPDLHHRPRARVRARTRKGSKAVKEYLRARSRKANQRDRSQSRRKSREVDGIAAAPEASGPGRGSSSTSRAGLSGNASVAPARVGRAADKQRRLRGGAERLRDLRPVQERCEPDRRARSTRGAAALPRDLRDHDDRARPARRPRGLARAWPRIQSNGSWSLGRPLVDLHHGPAARLRRLAANRQQRRLAEVADAGQEDRAAAGLPSCRSTQRP